MLGTVGRCEVLSSDRGKACGDEGVVASVRGLNDGCALRNCGDMGTIAAKETTFVSEQVR